MQPGTQELAFGPLNEPLTTVLLSQISVPGHSLFYFNFLESTRGIIDGTGSYFVYVLLEVFQRAA
jgi:hypothetical protein